MNAFKFLTGERKRKSEEGLTMMLDKGIGPVSVIDLLEISGDYVDLAKFGWGTSATHNRDLIKEKTEIYESYDVIPYPGGTLFEIAFLQNKLDEYLDEADSLGFQAIEISDGTININPSDREEVIGKVKDNGFLVISEVGKKNPVEDRKLTIQERVDLINFDLEAGADKVLIEGREGGKGIGIYDNDGKVKEKEINIIIENSDEKKIIWEAPQKEQQIYLILKFGPNVNLGNIPPEETTALETLRQGLRGDTLGRVKI
ncbi:MAG TPA: phosphosulfolactate synthase [Methanobacterium sp.]|nr:phosphosulfolactate synthase [Methanobacterium sp.]